MTKHNFSAGPAILPKSVLDKASEAARDFNGISLSLLELSHRGPEFTEILNRAVAKTHELTGLGDDYAVLFLTGGASSQFFMVPMNLLPQEGSADYLNTGRWSDNAIDEAESFGTVNTIASSKEDNYMFIPKDYQSNSNATYLHYTSNNTVAGTQFQNLPESEAPLVCDMSSDIFSKPLDFKRFGLIYAGAQKNLGPAGTTLVIVRKDLLGKVSRKIPTMLDYQTHVKKNSSYNTPPVFPIYVCLLTMEWILQEGGLKEMERRNKAKSQLLYSEIDRNPLFYGLVNKEDRSMMNATFQLHDQSQMEELMAMAKEAGCVGLKGHRSIGGLRASMYNALDLGSVEVLVDIMQEFERKKG